MEVINNNILFEIFDLLDYIHLNQYSNACKYNKNQVELYVKQRNCVISLWHKYNKHKAIYKIKELDFNSTNSFVCEGCDIVYDLYYFDHHTDHITWEHRKCCFTCGDTFDYCKTCCYENNLPTIYKLLTCGRFICKKKSCIASENLNKKYTYHTIRNLNASCQRCDTEGYCVSASGKVNIYKFFI
jgi:hypothetical protein